MNFINQFQYIKQLKSASFKITDDFSEIIVFDLNNSYNLKSVIGLDKLKSAQFINLSNTSVSLFPPILPPKILTLFLRNTFITFIETKEISKSLNYLDLSNNKITNVSNLIFFPKLITLNLSNTKIKNISILKKLKYIRYLDLSHTYINNLSSLKETTYLQNIDISYTNISDISFIHNLNLLEIVICDNCFIKELPIISINNKIKKISIKNNQIEDLKNIENYSQLSFIDLSENALFDLSFIKSIGTLEYLDVTNQNIYISAYEDTNYYWIKNEIIDENGNSILPDFISNNGFYDQTNNIIKWNKNLLSSGFDRKLLYYNFNYQFKYNNKKKIFNGKVHIEK